MSLTTKPANQSTAGDDLLLSAENQAALDSVSDYTPQTPTWAYGGGGCTLPILLLGLLVLGVLLVIA